MKIYVSILILFLISSISVLAGEIQTVNNNGELKLLTITVENVPCQTHISTMKAVKRTKVYQFMMNRFEAGRTWIGFSPGNFTTDFQITINDKTFNIPVVIVGSIGNNSAMAEITKIQELLLNANKIIIKHETNGEVITTFELPTSVIEDWKDTFNEKYNTKHTSRFTGRGIETSKYFDLPKNYKKKK